MEFAEDKYMHIEEVKSNGKMIAIIIPHDYDKPGISFFTPNEYSQQMAFMHHPKGHLIEPHVHNLLKREIQNTLEVLVIRSGRLRADFYDDDRNYLESRVLTGGDVMLLVSGGHGFECLEKTEMYEIKQGPYAGENDKIRFEPVRSEKIKIVEDETNGRNSSL